MGIFKSMAGMMTVELVSAGAEESLRQIMEQNIPVFAVRWEGDLTVRFDIYRHDFSKVSRFTDRRGEQLTVLRRRGLYWKGKALFKRPVLMTGMALLLFLVLFVPTRVFFVQVEGNDTLPARMILEAARQSGISFGASRREVRSEKMKNALLSALPELQWAGVNTYGCTAMITVRERTQEEAQETAPGVSSIVAARDGVILSCTVTRGNGVCTIGQAVRKGQTLISGYTDCGIILTATRAEGEILAQTRRSLSVKTPSDRQIRGEPKAQNTKFSLLVGKKRINFFKGSGISDGTCGKMYSKYVLTLPGGFQLPVALVKETTYSCDLETAEVLPEQAEELLRTFASDYLKSRMVAGSILQRTETVDPTQGAYCLTGAYACTEMIGRERSEEIGEHHGKTD